MKSTSIRKSYALITAGALLAVLTAGISRTEAASVQVSGTVSAVATISPGTATALDSSQLTSGVSDFAVVTINEKSNKKAGYTVTLQSQNAGSTAAAKLLGSSSGDTITYTIKYGGSAVTLVNGQAVVTNASDKTGNSGVDKVLSVTLPSGFPSADTYSDTLTVTLTNK